MAFICLLKIAMCDGLAWQHGWQQWHGEVCLGSSSHCAQQSLALCPNQVVCMSSCPKFCSLSLASPRDAPWLPICAGGSPFTAGHAYLG